VPSPQPTRYTAPSPNTSDDNVAKALGKGSRVRIKAGPASGANGSIFWVGNDRRSGGQRFGVRSDDGETHWVSESDCEASNAPEPTFDGPSFQKGDRVQFKNQGQTGTGSVFWIGDSRQGGQRLGVRNDDDPDNAVWIDARFCQKTDSSAPTPSHDGPTFEKGDRVSFRNQGQTGTGSVFWTGDGRQGGQRLGVRNDDDPDNAVWIDARFCEKIQGEAPAHARRQGGGGRRPAASGDWGADDDFVDNSWEAVQAGMREDVPEPPPDMGAPPMDDSYYDGLASSHEDDDDSPPW